MCLELLHGNLISMFKHFYLDVQVFSFTISTLHFFLASEWILNISKSHSISVEYVNTKDENHPNSYFLRFYHFFYPNEIIFRLKLTSLEMNDSKIVYRKTSKNTCTL